MINIYKMTQNEKNPYIDFIIDFVKNELLKSDFREEILQPLYITLLYYIIPVILFLVIMNFVTSLIAISIVLNFFKR